jgi:adenosylcobinamide-GDP ribazoletransferase
VTVPAPLRGARAAFFFLTRIPVGGYPYSDREWKWAAGWFPFVGLCLGVLLAAVWRLAQALGPLPAAALVLAAGLLLTGAFHEDGLADTADALGGAPTRERLFEILKDSRIGTFGAAALAISFLLRASLLVRLGPAAESALVLTQCLSRAPPVWLMSSLPYVSAAGSKSRPVVNGSVVQAAVATLWPAALVILFLVRGSLSPAGAAWLILACAGATIACGWRFARRAGGITGDFLGATQQVIESIALIALATVGFRGL